MGGYAGNDSEIYIEVTVKKDELLERLTKNREKHITEYKRALTLWIKDFKEALDKVVPEKCNDIPKGILELHQDRPISYVEEYDRAIDMFTMCIKNEIKFNTGCFQKLCRDEWDWKRKTTDNKYYLLSSM